MEHYESSRLTKFRSSTREAAAWITEGKNSNAGQTTKHRNMASIRGHDEAPADLHQAIGKGVSALGREGMISLLVLAFFFKSTIYLSSLCTVGPMLSGCLASLHPAHRKYSEICQRLLPWVTFHFSVPAPLDSLPPSQQPLRWTLSCAAESDAVNFSSTFIVKCKQSKVHEVTSIQHLKPNCLVLCFDTRDISERSCNI